MGDRGSSGSSRSGSFGAGSNARCWSIVSTSESTLSIQRSTASRPISGSSMYPRIRRAWFSSIAAASTRSANIRYQRLFAKKSAWASTCVITAFWSAEEFDSWRNAWAGSSLMTISNALPMPWRSRFCWRSYCMPHRQWGYRVWKPS